MLSVLLLVGGALAVPLASYQAPNCSITPAPAAFTQLQQNYTHNVLGSLNGTQCTAENIAVRRSWEALSPSERTEYIGAVKCLKGLPSKTDPALAPGARTRLDDFTYVHINQTNFIHVSGYFLPWHRYFVYEYELALRNECNYTGYQPYWDWATFANNQSESALFDGTPTSLGGNGLPVPHPVQISAHPGLPSPVTVTRQPGTGGGCVTTGPFADPTYNVTLGPVSPVVPGYMSQPPNDTFGNQYNPRCLKRDFLPSASTGNLTWTNVTNLLGMDSIHTFHPLMESTMHPAAHSFIGADGFDLFSSPNDPAFFFLHSQIDRIWTIWQGQDFASRTNALDGTRTFLNDPPSGNVTLNDNMNLGIVGGFPEVSTAMSTISGPFCYMYA